MSQHKSTAVVGFHGSFLNYKESIASLNKQSMRQRQWSKENKRGCIHKITQFIFMNWGNWNAKKLTMQWRSCSSGNSQQSQSRSHRLHIDNHSLVKMQWNLHNSQWGFQSSQPQPPPSHQFWRSHICALSSSAVLSKWSCYDQPHPSQMLQLAGDANQIKLPH